ncbi:MAG: hypothetical protein M3Y41_18025, partial [Pseudomonadota bacterium]|nr:hypothetical protein [Pseudomonadota bacterium]
MKTWWVLGVAMGLAACAGPVVPSPNSSQARYEPSARAVQVLVSNITPMLDAALIGPDGSRYPTTGVVVVS